MDMEKLERMECGHQISEGEEGSTENISPPPPKKCVCVCVCVREREIEREREQ